MVIVGCNYHPAPERATQSPERSPRNASRLQQSEVGSLSVSLPQPAMTSQESAVGVRRSGRAAVWLARRTGCELLAGPSGQSVDLLTDSRSVNGGD